MAERIGIGLNTYQRLELGLARDPGLNTLMRCAKALGVPLGAVVDPGWLDWGGEDGVLPEPPPGGFWSGNERAGERPSWVPEPEVDWEAWKE